MPSGGHRSPTAFIFLVNSLSKKIPLPPHHGAGWALTFPLTMGLAGRLPKKTVPYSDAQHRENASCSPESPAAVQLRKLVAGGEIPAIRARALQRGCSLYSDFLRNSHCFLRRQHQGIISGTVCLDTDKVAIFSIGEVRDLCSSFCAGIPNQG